MVGLLRGASLALLFAQVDGARVSRRKHAHGQNTKFGGCPEPKALPSVEGQQGKVDWLYTFGAPGVASPALQHATNEDGAFSGLRVWQAENGWVDLVPSVTNLANLRHPYLDGEVIEDRKAPGRYPANMTMTRYPMTIWNTASLHRQADYDRIIRQRQCDAWSTLSSIGNLISYMQNATLAAEAAAKVGWNLAGFGYYEASSDSVGGSQVSYLLQNPETLECVVTFQGTKSDADWVANLAFQPEKFCGYAGKRDKCGAREACQVQEPRGSFVHFGFAQQLRNIVQSESWQQDVHAQLGKCSAVYTTGHSLGGATATLFAACVSKQLEDGDFGYDTDYKHMVWVKGKPEIISRSE